MVLGTKTAYVVGHVVRVPGQSVYCIIGWDQRYIICTGSGSGNKGLTIVLAHIVSGSAANEVHRIVRTQHRYGILLSLTFYHSGNRVIPH